MGTFVVEMATSMSIIMVTAAKRVSRPRRKRTPQTISHTPTKGAMTCGTGIPILAKRPTPQGVRERELLDALREKHTADDQADQEDGGGGVGRQQSPQERHEGASRRARARPPAPRRPYGV